MHIRRRSPYRHPRPTVPRLRFGLVGVASTLTYFVLYLGLRPGIDGQAANLVALLVTAVANTTANRRLTFGVTGRDGLIAHHVGGLVAFGIALVLTSGSLGGLEHLRPTAGRMIEVAVLLAANAAATLVRFLALRLLMHRLPVAPVR